MANKLVFNKLFSLAAFCTLGVLVFSLSGCWSGCSCGCCGDKCKDGKKKCEVAKCGDKCCCGCCAENKVSGDTKMAETGDKKMTNIGGARQKSGTGLEWEVIKAGEGETPKVGQTVVVHYDGWLNESGVPGKKFDSSVDRGQKFEFQVGIGLVIKGWDEGLMAMKKGEKRRLFIPSYLAYGSRGAGQIIKPNSDLIFDVEIFDIR